MSLTTGRGPLSPNPAGRFSAPVPEGVVYVEPFPRRVRGKRNGDLVVDSEQVLLVHQPGCPPAFAFPAADVTMTAAEPEPAAPGHVRVPWDAVDEWYEEEERALGHPRNPYHRIDCLRASRHLRVEVGGQVIVDTHDTVVLYETSLAPKVYVHRAAVLPGILVPSTKTTYCPYKGTTTYWHAIVEGAQTDDVAWCYEDPLPESMPIRDLLSFEADRVTLTHDLPRTD